MLYFSYGSNMSSKRLVERVPSARSITAAQLHGHVLKCHKRSKDGSAKCDAFSTENSSDLVWGVIFDIDESQKGKLDSCEGLGGGYDRKTVTVTTVDGQQIDTFTYYATKDALDDSLFSYSWYKMHVLTGAREHGLPEDYVTWLETFEATDDPDRQRHERELSIY